MNTLPPDSNNELDGSHVPPFGSGGIPLDGGIPWPLSEEEAERQLRVGAALLGIYVECRDKRSLDKVYLHTYDTDYHWPEIPYSYRYCQNWREALEVFQRLRLDRGYYGN